MNVLDYNAAMAELNRKLAANELTREQFEDKYDELWEQVRADTKAEGKIGKLLFSFEFDGKIIEVFRSSGGGALVGRRWHKNKPAKVIGFMNFLGDYTAGIQLAKCPELIQEVSKRMKEIQ